MCATPFITYNNMDSNKQKIVYENKKKSGIYRITNLENGNDYVGSSVNLGSRF
jgi:GIY-YIG catalytic domain